MAETPCHAFIIPLIRGLRELAPDYDALIVDLWGVIHGGVEPYPGVLETLAALRTAGKPIGLLSNAPRRSQAVPGASRRSACRRSLRSAGDLGRGRP